MIENKNSSIVPAVVAGLSTLWTSYKSSTRRRHQSPLESFISDLCGTEMNDFDAAQYLAKDVAELRNTLRVKKTEKEFNKIIKNSYS